MTFVIPLTFCLAPLADLPLHAKWIGPILSTNIHGSQTMYPKHLSDPLAFSYSATMRLTFVI